MAPAALIKLVVVGDTYVGKTSLTSVFVENQFRETYSANTGGYFHTKEIGSLKATLQIWDTAGMERFRSLLPSFMRGAMCAIIVYDISNRESFLSVRDYWISYVNASDDSGLTVKVLVANKCDSQYKVVQEHEGRQLADSRNMLYFETSAKYKINVDKMFTEAAAAVLTKKSTPKTRQNNDIRLENTENSPKKKCC